MPEPRCPCLSGRLGGDPSAPCPSPTPAALSPSRLWVVKWVQMVLGDFGQLWSGVYVLLFLSCTHPSIHSFIPLLWAILSSGHVSDAWTQREQAGVGIQRLKSHDCPSSPTLRPRHGHSLRGAPAPSEHGGGRSQPGL